MESPTAFTLIFSKIWIILKSSISRFFHSDVSVGAGLDAGTDAGVHADAGTNNFSMPIQIFSNRPNSCAIIFFRSQLTHKQNYETLKYLLKMLENFLKSLSNTRLNSANFLRWN